MRLFIGAFARLDGYREIKEAFLALPLSWVAQEKLHLTYAFFGDEKAPDRLIKIVEQTPWIADRAVIKGLGHFNHKILYAKVEAKSVYQNFQLLSKEGELPNFIPHVTLARIKKCDPKRLDALIAHFNDRSLGRLESAVHLIQSRPGSQGTVYTVLR